MGEKITITVGIDTYVTIEEANEYINRNFSEESTEYKKWFNEDLSDNERARVLIRSAKALSTLKYTGAKLKRGQALDFPRKKMMMPGYYHLPFIPQNYDSSLIDGLTGGDNGLAGAKEAQIENAVVMMAMRKHSIVDTKTRQLSGMTSRKIDDISESYTNDSAVMYDVQTGLYAREIVESKLKSWLTSSVYTL